MPRDDLAAELLRISREGDRLRKAQLDSLANQGWSVDAEVRPRSSSVSVQLNNWAREERVFSTARVVHPIENSFPEAWVRADTGEEFSVAIKDLSLTSPRNVDPDEYVYSGDPLEGFVESSLRSPGGDGTIDGYAPGEYDGFHFTKFLGSIFAGFVGVILLSMMGDSEGEGSLWLLAIGGCLLVCSLAAAWLSGFYRRYHFLIWWKKLIIWIPGFLGAWAIIAIQIGSSYIFGGSYGGGQGSGRSANEAVDENGNVYHWNSWGGTWQPKSGFLGLGQERGQVSHGLFGPNPKTGAFGSSQYTDDGSRLYRRRD